MSQRQLVLTLGLIACLASPALTQESEPASIGVKGAYRVGPGDVLDITVFEVEELTGSVTVDSQGRIQLPLLEELLVAGGTVSEVAVRLERLYGQSLLRNPQIGVAVKQFRSQPVAILGAVERPGVYQLQGPRRLLELLAMAGGFTEQVGTEVLITRVTDTAGEPSASDPRRHATTNPPVGRPRRGDEARETRVSVKQLLAGDETSNPWIEPHGEIRVRKAGLVYVLGAVVRPGGYPIERETVTVLQAISLAQGLDRRAAPQKARIVRREGENKQEFGVRIGDMLRGKREDAELRDNDILFVPDSRAKGALSRGAEAALQMATGVIIWRR